MMKKLVLILLIIYLPIVMWTPFSLTGFYTDIIFSCSLSILGLWYFTYQQSDSFKKLIAVINALVTYGSITVYLIIPSSWSIFQVKVFDPKVAGQFLNLKYYKPADGSGCGYGSYWETTTFLLCPIIEYEEIWQPCTHSDWGQYLSTGKFE